MKTHTLQRSMEYLRDQGYVGEKVEMPWNTFTKKRKDFLGFIDAIFVKGKETIAVQACGADFVAHERKVLDAPYFKTWTNGGTRKVLLIGWTKKADYKKDGSRARVDKWTPRTKYLIPKTLPVLPDKL